MTSRLRAELPALVLLVGMWLLALLRWSAAPERIPVHWGLSGAPDRYGGRVEGLLLVPLLATGAWALFKVLPRLDPGGANFTTHARAWRAIQTVLLAFFAWLYVGVHLSLTRPEFGMGTWISTGMGATWIVLGNYLGKLRPNWFAGIRTPWTLSSERSWSRTHRLGGWLFVGTGVATLLGVLAGPRVALGALLVGSLGTAAVTTIYSWHVWKHDPDRVPPGGTTPAG